MIYSYAEEVQRIAERTLDNKQAIAQQNKQRRNSVVDMFGVPHKAFGDGNHPATVYLSVSPDLIHWSRFDLKIGIEPYMSTSASTTSGAVVDVTPTSLTIGGSSEGSIDSTSDHQGLVELTVHTESSGSGVTPNPHDHGTASHSHTIAQTISETHTTASDFRIKIDGVDVTPYLMAQHGGSWISGEGIFPTNAIEDQDDFYDILDVAGLLYASGYTAESEKLLKPGFKKVEITSADPFQVTVYAYKKYNYTGR